METSIHSNICQVHTTLFCCWLYINNIIEPGTNTRPRTSPPPHIAATSCAVSNSTSSHMLSARKILRIKIGRRQQDAEEHVLPAIPKHRLSITSSAAANCITRHCYRHRQQACSSISSHLRCDLVHPPCRHSACLHLRRRERAATLRSSPGLHERGHLGGACT